MYMFVLFCIYYDCITILGESVDLFTHISQGYFISMV